jgi:hypothetical protein
MGGQYGSAAVGEQSLPQLLRCGRGLQSITPELASSAYPLSLAEAQIQRAQKLKIHFHGCQKADSRPTDSNVSASIAALFTLAGAQSRINLHSGPTSNLPPRTALIIEKVVDPVVWPGKPISSPVHRLLRVSFLSGGLWRLQRISPYHNSPVINSTARGRNTSAY